MEVCGGQTHSIVKYGLDYLLPPRDRAGARPGLPGLRHAARDDRPGARHRAPAGRDLLLLRRHAPRARLARRPVPGAGRAAATYGSSTRRIDCLKIARANPDKKVVFFAIGFETTAPANAMAVFQAKALGIDELLVLVSHVLRAPGDHRHPAVAGQSRAGLPRAGPRLRRHGLARVRADRGPLPSADRDHRLRAARPAGRRLAWPSASSSTAARRSRTHMRARSTTRATSPARKMISRVFEVADRNWRGIGIIPKSGLQAQLRVPRPRRRADLRGGAHPRRRNRRSASAGQVLKGLKKPRHCPAFGTQCTPQTPLGATMVSAEGACAAYYSYGRHLVPVEAKA